MWHFVVVLLSLFRFSFFWTPCALYMDSHLFTRQKKSESFLARVSSVIELVASFLTSCGTESFTVLCPSTPNHFRHSQGNKITFETRRFYCAYATYSSFNVICSTPENELSNSVRVFLFLSITSFLLFQEKYGFLMKPSSVAINILSDSIVRQKNRVHLLSYTMMNNNHVFYYSIGIRIEETISMVLGIKSIRKNCIELSL